MEIEKATAYILDKLGRELPKTLHYHSVDHVLDVLNVAEHIATLEGVTGDDFILLKTAAMYHDSGFIVQGKDHEHFGCELVKKILPEFNYNGDQIKKICGMIIATRIPQMPCNLLEQILCDADLDYIGRDDYWKISNYLFKEINESAQLLEIDWLKIQIEFLDQHHFFTATAINERKEKKAIYIQKLKEILIQKSI